MQQETGLFRRLTFLYGSAAQPEAEDAILASARIVATASTATFLAEGYLEEFEVSAFRQGSRTLRNLGPVYWATYKTSLSVSLMLTRFGFTSKPKMLDTTFAVSTWPMADSMSVGTSFGLIFFTRTKFIASMGNMDRENAFVRMCCAIILSFFSCLSIRRSYRDM